MPEVPLLSQKHDVYHSAQLLRIGEADWGTMVVNVKYASSMVAQCLTSLAGSDNQQYCQLRW